MAKHSICAILSIFALFIAMQINVDHARELADEEDELLLEYICLKNQKLAKIHFYVQDVAEAPDATVYEVTRAAVSSNSLLSFGKILVVDDIIAAAAPGGNSEKFGKAQGVMICTDKEASAMNFNIALTSGRYNGSTLSIAGRDQLLDRQRNQLAVIGGSGVFRYTRGYAVVSTYSSRVGDDSVVYSVLEYTIYATFCQSM